MTEEKSNKDKLQNIIDTIASEASQKAANEALDAIKSRSYSGRHPELGKMINCQFCGMRHRENNPLRKCEQKFVTELAPPEHMTVLTPRQIFGAAMFNRHRQSARRRPKNKMHHWLRVVIEARKKHEQA